MIEDRHHRDSSAITTLTMAVTLAQSEGIRRPFHLIGGRLPDILARYQHLGVEHDAFVTARSRGACEIAFQRSDLGQPTGAVSSIRMGDKGPG